MRSFTFSRSWWSSSSTSRAAARSRWSSVSIAPGQVGEPLEVGADQVAVGRVLRERAKRRSSRSACSRASPGSSAASSCSRSSSTSRCAAVALADLLLDVAHAPAQHALALLRVGLARRPRSAQRALRLGDRDLALEVRSTTRQSRAPGSAPGAAPRAPRSGGARSRRSGRRGARARRGSARPGLPLVGDVVAQVDHALRELDARGRARPRLGARLRRRPRAARCARGARCAGPRARRRGARARGPRRSPACLARARRRPARRG